MENKSSDRQGKISLDKIVREIAELESSRGEPDKIWSLSDIDELIASTNAVSPVPADEDDAELLTSIQYYEDAYSDDKASGYEPVREPEPEYEPEETAEPEQGADEPDVDISDKTDDEAPAEPEEANKAPAEAEPADEMPAEEAESEEAVEAPAEEEDEAPVEDAVSEKRTAPPLRSRLPKKNPTALTLRPRTKPPPRTAKRYTQIQNSSCRSQRATATAIRIQMKTAKPSGRRLFLSTARMRPRRTAQKRKSRLSRSFSARRRQDISVSPPRRRRTTPKTRSAPYPDFLTIPLCSVR